jgi:HEAT repeat protein
MIEIKKIILSRHRVFLHSLLFVFTLANGSAFGSELLGFYHKEKKDPSVEDVIRNLRGVDIDARKQALKDCYRLGKDAALAVDALEEILISRELRIETLHALGQLGVSALPALKTITAQLADENPAIRDAAERVLTRIGPGALDALTPYLSKNHLTRTRLSALNVAVFLGKSAAELRPILNAMLQDEDERIRRATATAVRFIFPDEHPFMTPLAAQKTPEK